MEPLPEYTERPDADHADDEQAGYPVIQWHQGQPVPDLNRIVQDRWREVLAPLTQPVRDAAVRRVRRLEDSRQAAILTMALYLEDGDRAQEAQRRTDRPRGLPAPAVTDARETASRQVNFRISAGQHTRLTEAAQRVGAKPGQLARILTMRGVEHLLWEERSRT